MSDFPKQKRTTLKRRLARRRKKFAKNLAKFNTSSRHIDLKSGLAKDRRNTLFHPAHIARINKTDFDLPNITISVVLFNSSRWIEKFLNSGGLIFSKSNSAITIYVESTPNPGVMKFVCNKRLFNTSHEFNRDTDNSKCNLATALLHHEFISEIYFDMNFISISINKNYKWQEYTAAIREFITSFINDGNEIIDPALDKQTSANNAVRKENLDGISKNIIDLIENQIKPAVASDGGNILFDSYNENTKEVSVILQGACSGCPSSTITLKNGIETMLKNELPGKISSVVAING